MGALLNERTELMFGLVISIICRKIKKVNIKKSLSQGECDSDLIIK